MWYSYLIKKILLKEIQMKIAVTYDEDSEEVFLHLDAHGLDYRICM